MLYVTNYGPMVGLASLIVAVVVVTLAVWLSFK